MTRIVVVPENATEISAAKCAADKLGDDMRVRVRTYPEEQEAALTDLVRQAFATLGKFEGRP